MSNRCMLIGEAGGTNTQWRLAREKGQIEQFATTGFNPQTSSLATSLGELTQSGVPMEEVTHLYFYAAGLVSKEQKVSVKQLLSTSFSNASIEVESDVLAAARGLCGSNQGWVGFLGTGAGLTFYDGVQITRQIPSLGYILGDEGSGAYIGRLLTRDYYREKLPTTLREKLANSFEPYQEELSKIYKTDAGSAYLARLAAIIFPFRDTPYVDQLIRQAFTDYFEAFSQGAIDEPIHFTGSVAFHFNAILREVAVDKGFFLGKIVESPIAGLLLFHEAV